METKITNQDANAKLFEVSAWDISKYLLSLDEGREYFSNTNLLIVDNKDNYRSNPTIGNFRLNKMLQIIQSLHYAYYKKRLFLEEIKAYEHGGIVYLIFKNFFSLHKTIDYVPDSLTKEKIEFIRKSFTYLKDNYSDNELRNLAHQDLAWRKAWKRKILGKGDGFVYDEEVLNYYDKLGSSMLRAMKIKPEY
jgi:uncharacterized phage-associated protein